MNLFQYIDFETIGNCNRRCPTCIRNSHPDKDEISSWFSGDKLRIFLIKEALDQCKAMGFTGGVCLSHYNEPLMDDRIVDIAELVKAYQTFSPIFLNTNGDFLTKDLADRLDGNLDRIIVSLYMDEPKKSERARWVESLFHKTEAIPITMSEHIPTHFSPKFDVDKLSRMHRNNRCLEASIRVIINHRRQYLLCCDDVVGNFDLGTFPEIGIEEYWFGEKHVNIARDLMNSGGRNKHSYCVTCPRP